jgi:ketosteroid isomerase-like protein
MNSGYPIADEQLRMAREYFSKVDAGDASLLEMFTEDAQLYFPKYGTAHGKAEFLQLIQGLTSAIARFVHDESLMVFTQSGNRLVVEGIESGFLTDGRPFPAGARSEGRYCNVFEFRGNLISRMHIHADPDLAGQHKDLFPWN